jgi:hypothetical protein
MIAEGRVQGTLSGIDLKSVTVPPDPEAFLAAEAGSLFVEFDVPTNQIAQGGRSSWGIIFGPNSIHGRLSAIRGTPVSALPRVQNVVVRTVK